MQYHHSEAARELEKEPATSLEISIGEMDNQLSRFFNALNRLDVLADKLKSLGPTPIKDTKSPEPAPPSDHCGKLEFQNGVFNHLNNRLESVVEYLSRTI